MAKVQKKTKDSAEAKRWLIVGAYQAGATEKHVARIAGLSRTAVRNIILNYQRTGTPCIPKKIPNKVRQRLIVEYDEDGNIIDTDDEDDTTNAEENTIDQHASTGRKKQQKNSSRITTKDIINYAMDQMRISAPPSETVPTTPTTPTPSTHNPKALVKMPPPSKFDQTIRGYELWTHEDDMVLLNHVLHHLHGGGWCELEVRFNGRHSARLCYDRWKHLRSLLLRGVTDKPNTPW